MADNPLSEPPTDFWRLWDDHKETVARLQAATERCGLRLAIATGCFGVAAGMAIGWLAGKGLI